MRMVDWGNGWKVSHLCFGALPMGPLQKGLSPYEGGKIIARALACGVNFIDTAQSYRTYEHIREGLKGHQGRVYIASKSAATSYEDMENAVEEACQQLGRDHIDIFHLHAGRADDRVFLEREEALRCLKDLKARGVVGNVGLATHSVEAVAAAAERDDVDVVFPLINLSGMGILHGGREEMEGAIARAQERGKLLYAMKVYAGGNLLDRRREALEYALSVPGIEVLAIGMVSCEELEVNLALLDGSGVEPGLWDRTGSKAKAMVILGLCRGCGSCVDLCPNNALEVVGSRCQVKRDQCILCGYCAPGCPLFAIRFV